MNANDLLRAAARCWERAGHYDRAAERWSAADAWSAAGRCLAAAGRHVEAAEAYGRAGDSLSEARQWLLSPWPERARGVYRRILEAGTSGGSEVEALLGLGEIGRALERSLGLADDGAGRLEALRRLARLASSRGRPDVASRVWSPEADGSGDVHAEWERFAPWNRSLRWERPLDGTAGPPFPWASEWGEDEFGRFVAFTVGGQTQRLRWIPPGTFLMGSPETEAGRRSQEGPQHEVTLTRGFWLAETPCTQGLWEAVTGENPSTYRSPDRPVEQVSWEDCQRFVDALNVQAPGLEARLPSEAEWEYACRAGTATSTYVGELEILGENNAPLLDSIAWYGGNSGVGFELENGWNSSGWPAKQYPHTKAGSHPVAEKAPNGWGLYDMLGNVWEWCSDLYGPYRAESVVDPQGPAEGSLRVFRGGSWYDIARYARAAYRLWHGPGGRFDSLGFRLARGQGE